MVKAVWVDEQMNAKLHSTKRNEYHSNMVNTGEPILNGPLLSTEVSKVTTNMPCVACEKVSQVDLIPLREQQNTMYLLL